MLSYEAGRPERRRRREAALDDDRAADGPIQAPGDTAPAPFLTEQQRALRAVVVGMVLGAVLAAFARGPTR